MTRTLPAVITLLSRQDREEIRYSGVGISEDGHPIDLVVTVDKQSKHGPYSAHNVSNNGLWNNGSFGQINLRSSSEAP